MEEEDKKLGVSITDSRLPISGSADPIAQVLALFAEESGRGVSSRSDFERLKGRFLGREKGFVLEYFLTSSDGRGMSLVGFGSEAAPESAHVEAGSVSEGSPFYETVWFWAAAGLVAAAAGTAGYVVYKKSSEIPGGGDLPPVSLHR